VAEHKAARRLATTRIQQQETAMATLSGQVAVVAGATRGAGRGIARALGEAGATVYCSGRSSRGRAREHAHHYADRPETIEETAELVTAAGGEGIAVVVDHKDHAQVKKLFARIRRERKRLDILVNVLTHTPVEEWKPFWRLDMDEGRGQVDGWIWPHVMTARYALPLMVANRAGLVVEIIEQEGVGYHGQMWFDLFETTLKRLAYAVAVEGADHGITAVALTPGFMRTEAIKDDLGASDDNWKEVALTHPRAKAFGFIASETPVYAGRAIVALAADPERQRFSGGVLSSGTLSECYDFTDVDGARPNMPRYLAEHHPELFLAKPGVRHWTVQPSPS
jgi:NAD(P)-dependent dehydrogenase (short-subunit alcohol dehydrogenase family)